MDGLRDVQKRREFLICVDSDGCAMDTMEIKHRRCFAPRLIEEWELGAWEDSLKQRWNQINLYAMTRGINRFKGLLLLLEEADCRCRPIEGLKELRQWLECAGELSEAGLERRIAEGGGAVFQKALAWSRAVNRSIEMLPKEELKPFSGAAEGIQAARGLADVAVVSSANPEAVKEEWARFGLLDCADTVLAQDAGSKRDCIRRLLALGYERERAAMVGDAPGDRQAARENGVWFYPILVGREKESWLAFSREFLPRLFSGAMDSREQARLDRNFEENLQKGSSGENCGFSGDGEKSASHRLANDRLKRS